MNNNYVAIIKTETFEYPDAKQCFCPDEHFPEDPLPHRGINSNNKVYKAVRDALYFMNMDSEHFGTKQWNPFKNIVCPGDTVLIKPNLVMDVNKSGDDTDCLYTQASVVAPIIDYIIIALKGSGKIIIGDAPMQECNFDRLLKESGYWDLVEFYKHNNIDIEITDFRGLKSIVKNGVHIQKIVDDIKGKVIDLKNDSEFSNLESRTLERMRITNYDPSILNKHHTDTNHEYYIAEAVLAADVIINVPKPKTHRKAGATISLKNMIGVNIRKEFLPHHTLGSLKDGGDEYKDKNKIHEFRTFLDDKINSYCYNKKYKMARLLKLPRIFCSLALKLMQHSYSEGSWYGNHTISKTISDINKIIYYADKNGIMQDTQQRRIFIIADMIVSGENEGPLLPTHKDVGIIVAGYNPVLFDETVATLMGFDYKKIPAIINARSISGKYQLIGDEEVTVLSNKKELCDIGLEEFPKAEMLNFIPTDGWKKHIELNN